MDAIVTVHHPQPRNTRDLLTALQHVRDASIDADERLRREPGSELVEPLTIGMPASAVDQLIAELELSLTRADVIAGYQRELRKMKAIAVGCAIGVVITASALIAASHLLL